ncbi:hypothetical protein WAF17_07275 [Bernardetia sp. ABR2-2B]|uniref:hypothetical protein n=1 Tax=Bernardetia sp. ABR2-2B TaxID=3127472 RepID=UPI0030CEF812
MKSITFRNLVLGFYFCVGFSLLLLNERSFITLWNTWNQSKIVAEDLIINNNKYVFLVTLPFFVGVVLCLFYRETWILCVIYYVFAASVYVLLDPFHSNMDIILSMTGIFVILFTLICLGMHPHFSEFSFSKKDSNIILDEFEISAKTKESKSYFLRIHRVFSLAFMIITITAIISSIDANLNHYKDISLIFLLFGFVILIFTVVLWNFPKVASWIIALTLIVAFIAIEFFVCTDLLNEDYTNYRIMSWLESTSIIGLAFIPLFIALILISKTAKEEWKMK